METNRMNGIKYLIALIVFSSFFIVGLLTHSYLRFFNRSSDASMPEDNYRIVPAEEGLPENLKTFSGCWRGQMNGILDYILIVKDVNEISSQIYLSWGDYPEWNTKKGSENRKAKVVLNEYPELVIEKSDKEIFTVKMGYDRETLIGNYIKRSDKASFPTKIEYDWQMIDDISSTIDFSGVIVFKRMDEDQSPLIEYNIPKPEIFDIDLPSDIFIDEAPECLLDKRIALFSGRWEGNYYGLVDIVMIVSKIDNKEAQIIISYGSYEPWDVFKCYEEGPAKIIKTNYHDIRLLYRNKEGDKHEFILNKSGYTLEVIGFQDGWSFGGYLRKTKSGT